MQISLNNAFPKIAKKRYGKFKVIQNTDYQSDLDAY